MGYEFVPSPETIFGQVRRLAPGHSLTWAPGEEPRVERYWRLRVRAAPRDRGEHERLLREALQRAVERQLVSDVPLGVFLSGGLDSSAIVAMMSRLSDVPIDTFSLYYEDGSYSELEYADFVANQFGTRHHVIRIDPVTPETIEASCYHLDEPMTDLSAVPFYLLCKKVREYVTVCLSGEGGDELLCGYDRFRASKLNRIYERLPRVLREGAIAKAVDRLPDRPQKKGSINLLKRFIEGSVLPEEGRHMRWQYFLTPRVQESLFTREVQAQVTDSPFAPVRRILEGAEVDDEVAAEIYVDTCMTMPDSLLVKADKLSMAHALEVRVPFLDHEFAELCCTIPSDLKLEGFRTKSIFRSAMRGILPDKIRGRGKQGYSLPIKNWIRGELREFMEDTFASSTLIGECFDRAFVRILLQEHMERRANHSHVLWAILNLLVWHRLFVAPPAENPGRTLTGTSTG
jgi:asparagine synthase (glutamine-hydrolysing)